MDVAHPIRSVVPSLHGAVLEVLVGTHMPLSGRQIARLVRPTASQKGVLNALNDLVEAGLVFREDVPPAALFQLNRDHLASPAIIALASLPSRLVEAARNWLASVKVRPAAAALFGSAARRDGDSGSDIDVLLVRPRRIGSPENDWKEQSYAFAQSVERWTGNAVQVLDLSLEQLDQAVREQAPLITELRHDAIDLMAGELAKLIGTAPVEKR